MNFLFNKKYGLAKVCVSMLLMFSSQTLAATISGVLNDNTGQPLSGANVWLEGTNLGSATDLQGKFVIKSVKTGQYMIKATLLGYEEVTREISINEHEDVTLNLSTEYDPVALEELVYKVDRQKSHISVDKPIRTEVVAAQEMQAASTDGGVLSALSNRTGLNTRPCALCGSAGIGMQGMDPSYTEIRVDGLPVMSGLGSLYGLDGIAVGDLSRVELTKGTGSSEAGAGAMAGAVNLVTSDGNSNPSYNVNLSGSDTGRHTINGSVSYPVQNIPTRLTVTYSAEPEKIDRDDDGLTDTPSYDRLNLALNLTPFQNNGVLKLRGRFYTENRFAGETNWTESDQGSSTVYGRDINTNRSEFSFSYKRIHNSFVDWSFESAFVRHEQESWYGTTPFNAEQTISTSKLILHKNWNRGNNTSVMAEYHYEDYNDNLNLGSPTDKLFQVPGALVQHTWSPSDSWKTQYGLRGEFYDEDGLVIMPRGSVMYNPVKAWTFRLTAGSGYRPITLFSLDKAVHAGFEHVIVPADLKAEKSIGGSFSVNWERIRVGRVFRIDVSAFYTQFENKAILSFTENINETIYSNAEDAFSRGLELQTSYQIGVDWSFMVGGTLSQVRYKNDGEWVDIHMQNQYTGQFSIMRYWDYDISTEFNGNFFGPQNLPDGRSRDESPAYAIFDLGISKKFNNLTLAATIKNLADYTQPDNPFLFDSLTNTRKMDSAMIYGPLLGRLFQVSLSYNYN